MTSVGYAPAGMGGWRNSMAHPLACVALAEIINLPHRFTSSSPYYVVHQTEWIMWQVLPQSCRKRTDRVRCSRYLLVKTRDHNTNGQPASQDGPDTTLKKSSKIPFMVHDSRRQPLLSGKAVGIPQPSYKLQKLLALCQKSHVPPDFDEEDKAVFNAPIEI